jgi:uncharacterized protein
MVAPTKRWIDKINSVFYRMMDKMRDKRAFEVAAESPTGHDFAGFEKVRQVVLVTYRRDGEAVPSPIYHGVADGKVYVRTDARTAKIKRLRNNPRAVLVPSSFRGKPVGQAVSATARILADSEVAHADAVIAANWNLGGRMFERGVVDTAAKQFDLPTAYVEFTPVAP